MNNGKQEKARNRRLISTWTGTIFHQNSSSPIIQNKTNLLTPFKIDFQLWFFISFNLKYFLWQHIICQIFFEFPLQYFFILVLMRFCFSSLRVSALLVTITIAVDDYFNSAILTSQSVILKILQSDTMAALWSTDWHWI